MLDGSKHFQHSSLGLCYASQPVIFMRSYGLSLLIVPKHLPVLVFQSLIVPSWLPLAMVFPLGLKTTVETQSVCPCNIFVHNSFFRSHRCTVQSSLPLAIVLLSGLKATDPIAPVWPASVLRR
jgi:hypothetical protein